MPAYRIEWLGEAKADVPASDQPTAMRIFEGILRLARSGSGDVVTLQGDLSGWLRLRIGDYRVLFTIHDDAMRLFGVRHRSKACR